MKRMIVLAAAAALAACGGDRTDQGERVATEEAAANDPSAAGFEAVAPGNYEIVHPNGTIDQLTVHPGLTWSMIYADDSPAGGTIFAQDGKNCFVTEGVEGHECFLGTPPAADGSIQVTGDDGGVAMVRPVESFAETSGR